MLRKILVATTLLAASSAALASDNNGYGRVVTSGPQFSISFGTGFYNDTHHDYRPARHYYPPTRHHYREESRHYSGYSNNRRHDRHAEAQPYYRQPVTQYHHDARPRHDRSHW